MSWENSKALTPLKRDFLEAFFARDQSFYLTGGSALGIFYLEHRLSYDLDLFTPDPVNWHLLENLIVEISEVISGVCRTVTASPRFYRFELRRGGEMEVLDFVVERITQIDSVKAQFGSVRVDTLREIGVNKICTLISRCELKDVIDLYFLRKRGFDILGHFEAAKTKEGGLDPAMIAFLLSQLEVDRVPAYVIAPLDLGDLRVFIAWLRESMAARSFPQ
jgi:hypothetical protein